MVLGSVLVRAQHYNFIDNHSAGWYYMIGTEVIQLGDGNLLCRSLLDNLDENGQPSFEFIGYMYYWISYDELTVTDSLFIPSDDLSPHLWARLHQNGNTPQEYSNLDASIVTGENNTSFLNIAFFDDQLNYNADMEVTVPLTDSEIAIVGKSSWLLDTQNDIILIYSIPSSEETHFVRYGLDGTLKHETIFTSEEMPVYTGSEGSPWQPEGLTQYSDSPMGYNYFGWSHLNNQRHVFAYQFDSDFNILNTYDLVDQPTYQPNGYEPNTHANGGNNAIVSLEDSDALIVRNTKLANGHNATGVVKYDNEGNVLKEAWFNPFDNNREFLCAGLEKDGQGHVYFSGYTTGGNGGDKQIAVIKMDEDLNVIWEYSGMPGNMYRVVENTAFLNNDVFAVMGQNNYWDGDHLVTGMFLTLLSNQNDAGVDEANNSLRPYLYFPNPVADRLNVHYSPDATPKTVELYDLQGRLVRTQTNNFESIDMLNLPSGTYTLRIVLDNGKAYSDKIVKQ